MNTKIRIGLQACALAAMAFLTGCVSAITATGNGKVITSVTETTLGLKVSQQTQSQTPEVSFGYNRVTVVLEPANTNGPIYSPNYANTFGFDQSSVMGFGLDESVASGNYQTAKPNGTNTTSSQPIQPK